MDLRRKLREFVARSPTALNVGTLLTGTLLAQVIVLITAPIVSRLYSSSDMGTFAAFMTIPQTIAVVAGLRYDVAVVLPDKDDDARRLVRVVLAIGAVVSVVTSLVMWAGAPTIASWLNHPDLAPWLGWSGAVVAATLLVNTMGYWLTRTVNYRAISANRVTQALAIQGLRVATGSVGRGALPGLIGSQILGQSVAAATLAWRGRDVFTGSTAQASPVRDLLIRHRRMPLLNAPNALVDAIRANGIIILIGYFYAADPQGQFSQAWLLMQAPVALVTGAVSQVFYQRFATIPRGHMRGLIDRSIRLSLIAGALPFAALAIIAPWLFSWYLGPGWEQTGLMARALVPWLLLMVVSSPISTVYVVTERQGLMLAFALIYAATPLSIIAWLGSEGIDVVTTLWVVSLAMASLLGGLLVLTRRVARAWDRGVVPDVDGPT